MTENIIESDDKSLGKYGSGDRKRFLMRKRESGEPKDNSPYYAIAGIIVIAVGDFFYNHPEILQHLLNPR